MYGRAGLKRAGLQATLYITLDVKALLFLKRAFWNNFFGPKKVHVGTFWFRVNPLVLRFRFEFTFLAWSPYRYSYIMTIKMNPIFHSDISRGKKRINLGYLRPWAISHLIVNVRGTNNKKKSRDRKRNNLESRRICQIEFKIGCFDFHLCRDDQERYIHIYSISVRPLWCP